MTFLILFFGACSGLPDEKYIQLVKEEGGEYNLHQNDEKLQMTMSLLPPRYMALREKYDSNNSTDFDLNSSIKVYKNYLNLNFTLGIEGTSNFLEEVVTDMVQYQELVQYLSYGIQKDFTLCIAQDTLQAHFVHFERDYGLTPNANIQIGFNLSEDLKKKINTNDFFIGFNAQHFGRNTHYFQYESDLL